MKLHLNLIGAWSRFIFAHHQFYLRDLVCATQEHPKSPFLNFHGYFSVLVIKFLKLRFVCFGRHQLRQFFKSCAGSQILTKYADLARHPLGQSLQCSHQSALLLLQAGHFVACRPHQFSKYGHLNQHSANLSLNHYLK